MVGNCLIIHLIVDDLGDVTNMSQEAVQRVLCVNQYINQ